LAGCDAAARRPGPVRLGVGEPIPPAVLRPVAIDPIAGGLVAHLQDVAPTCSAHRGSERNVEGDGVAQLVKRHARRPSSRHRTTNLRRAAS
jgi:hypothetical protein